MSNETNPTPDPVRRLVGRVLETCRGYEYYYDAYFGPDAPFPDERPEPAKVAEALQDLCRTIPDAIRHLTSELTDLRLDVWGQYALDMGDGWQSDGALSTLESIADDLMDSGVFERHPERPWYRVRAPNPERSGPTADAESKHDVAGSADATC